jgi:hypothetical protein
MNPHASSFTPGGAGNVGALFSPYAHQAGYPDDSDSALDGSIQQNAEGYFEVSNFCEPNVPLEGICSVAFDPYEELLWTGTASVRVSRLAHCDWCPKPCDFSVAYYLRQYFLSNLSKIPRSSRSVPCGRISATATPSFRAYILSSKRASHCSNWHLKYISRISIAVKFFLGARQTNWCFSRFRYISIKVGGCHLCFYSLLIYIQTDRVLRSTVYGNLLSAFSVCRDAWCLILHQACQNTQRGDHHMSRFARSCPRRLESSPCQARMSNVIPRAALLSLLSRTREI